MMHHLTRKCTMCVQHYENVDMLSLQAWQDSTFFTEQSPAKGATAKAMKDLGSRWMAEIQDAVVVQDKERRRARMG